MYVPPLDTADLFDDAFRAIARDGATQVEVQLRLLKALRALAAMGDAGFQRTAREQARLALARAERAMPLEEDKALLRAVVREEGRR